MTRQPSSIFEYQLKGSLEPDAPSYVVRQADQEFYEKLKNGEYCYVLSSPQMGKSSLRARTMQKLQAEGIVCSVINPASFGKNNISSEDWYLALVRKLAQNFGIKCDVNQWWHDREGLSPVYALNDFLETVLLEEIPQKMVIFIDEIERIIQLKFQDSFFTLIRACYNQRAEKESYRRLTFALLGVTTVSDLVQNKNLTPFNIGRAIKLKCFRLDEVQPLAKGLEGKADKPQKVLEEILVWTGGQPFLTQKLCQLVFNSPLLIPTGRESELIERLARSCIIDNWESQDQPEHLQTIRDRFFSKEKLAIGLLKIYQQIWQQGKVAVDYSLEHKELQLSGLVINDLGNLRVCNRIYKLIFDQKWIRQNLEELYRKVLDAQRASKVAKELFLSQVTQQKIIPNPMLLKTLDWE